MKEECWETQPCLLTELPSVPGLRGGLHPLPASPCAGWLGALGTANGTARPPPPKFSVVSSLPGLDAAVPGENNRLAAPHKAQSEQWLEALQQSLCRGAAWPKPKG